MRTPDLTSIVLDLPVGLERALRSEQVGTRNDFASIDGSNLSGWNRIECGGGACDLVVKFQVAGAEAVGPTALVPVKACGVRRSIVFVGVNRVVIAEVALGNVPVVSEAIENVDIFRDVPVHFPGYSSITKR